LDMGFEPQIREIVEKRDMPHCSDGRLILIHAPERDPETLSGLHAQVHLGWRRAGRRRRGHGSAELTPRRRALEAEAVEELLWGSQEYTLIFTATKQTAAELVQSLAMQGLSAGAVHGDMEQLECEASLKKFRTGVAKLFVARREPRLAGEHRRLRAPHRPHGPHRQARQGHEFLRVRGKFGEHQDLRQVDQLAGTGRPEGASLLAAAGPEAAPLEGFGARSVPPCGHLPGWPPADCEKPR
jgi:hypothetical protein